MPTIAQMPTLLSNAPSSMMSGRGCLTARAYVVPPTLYDLPVRGADRAPSQEVPPTLYDLSAHASTCRGACRNDSATTDLTDRSAGDVASEYCEQRHKAGPQVAHGHHSARRVSLGESAPSCSVETVTTAPQRSSLARRQHLIAGARSVPDPPPSHPGDKAVLGTVSSPVERALPAAAPNTTAAVLDGRGRRRDLRHSTASCSMVVDTSAVGEEDEEDKEDRRMLTNGRSRDDLASPKQGIVHSTVAPLPPVGREEIIPACRAREAMMHSPVQKQLDHSASPPELSRRCVRVRVGILYFKGGSFAISNLFATSRFRAILHLGLDAPVRWTDVGPKTQQQTLKCSRAVYEDGRYAVRACCEFDEAFDMPLPVEGPAPKQLCVDVWIERRTVIERLDGLLGRVGLGEQMPAYDREWLGRIVTELPEVDEDAMPVQWPTTALNPEAGHAPQPTALSLGVEWVPLEPDDAEQPDGSGDDLY